MPRHNLAIVAALSLALGVIVARATNVTGPGVITYAIFAAFLAAVIIGWFEVAKSWRTR